MENRMAVIGILVSEREDAAEIVNKILSDYSKIIVGRMGIPYREKGVSIMSIIVDGTTDEIGALTGRLGNLNNVKTKVAMMK